MHHFDYRDGKLFAEEVSVTELAETYGTPLYIYSAATFRRHFEAFDSAFKGLDHLTCYSVKANSNLSVLKLLADMGAGMDVVSGGELFRALKAGVPAEKIVYSGVGKRAEEIRQALEAGILMFNVESLAELHKIDEVAGELGKTARISIRINPDVDPQTHPYISTGMKKNKFGLDIEHSLEAYKIAMELDNIEPVGMDCHIGSQLTNIDPFLEALDKLLKFYEKLKEMGLEIKYLDLGGGLGISYDDEQPPHPTEFGEALAARLKDVPLKVILEPGRVIAGNAGIMVTEVVYTKSNPTKNFLIVDGAMNDLIRPSLYGSYHRIAEVEQNGRDAKEYDVVGPICESGDFLARDRELPAVEQGERIALFSAGAYGFTMASNYNTRPRACELIVDGDTVSVARKRETYEDLIANEL
ncbi:Diaminopimelate decarboxylase [Pseudodesulfovibrio profundus]|uniref:Diaminopimelate decarboxylase n=1 Tax=Pseudodesulfovibrio profundus TaxID=57320 RepID=A0A2C8F4H0_9BACT|nr:diaminopimelate decarboxylase [Pseudodesulfovibrio profundus]MBC18437.1 diaminopimelate decarboxylase [Desulfovibrio sp.]SOB57285.1 Diaminopimelate decarboxylase [Pseudodesulfovibrio profundus]|tara:strand:- start:3618 stop:4856 length:1239 start_codon:yes stop_codon:yes gene_type:complete